MKKQIANNKKAYHDYFIEKEYQCGIALQGTEVKALRMGRCSIKESFIKIIGHEAFILGMNISPYEKGNIFNHDALRDRKLLLHKHEITKLKDAVQQAGYTLVPLRVYFLKHLVKVDIGLAKGKKLHDKRESIKKRDLKREAARSFKIGNL
ncbi:MAG: SsrA-binding protein SmpB [Eubacteriales bacterium]|nr:SsrA-binding protein SmpB [Eubacteriales bacterium]